MIKEFKSAQTGNDRTLLRTKLSRAIAEFVSQIEFDFTTKTFTVIVLNGLAAYRFHRMAHGADGRSARFGLKGSVSVLDQVREGSIPAEAFVPHAITNGLVKVVDGAEPMLDRIERISR